MTNNDISSQVVKGARDGALVTFILKTILIVLAAFAAPNAHAIMAYPGSAMTSTCPCFSTSYTMSPYTGGGFWIFSRLLAM